MSRFSEPPESIASVTRRRERGQARERSPLFSGPRAGGWHLVRGEIVQAARADRPLIAQLPYGLDAALAPKPFAPPAATPGEPEAEAPRAEPEPPEVVVIGADLEAPLGELSAPPLGDRERVERARDLVIADGSGLALLRLADAGGHLHPDVELHLSGPVRHAPLPPRWDEAGEHERRDAWIRLLRIGDPVYVLGRAAVVPDPSRMGPLAQLMAGGYRDTPNLVVFAGETGPLHLYDEAAYRQRADWEALPILEKAYLKMSAWVRSRF